MGAIPKGVAHASNHAPTSDDATDQRPPETPKMEKEETAEQKAEKIFKTQFEETLKALEADEKKPLSKEDSKKVADTLKELLKGEDSKADEKSLRLARAAIDKKKLEIKATDPEGNKELLETLDRAGEQADKIIKQYEVAQENVRKGIETVGNFFKSPPDTLKKLQDVLSGADDKPKLTLDKVSTEKKPADSGSYSVGGAVAGAALGWLAGGTLGGAVGAAVGGAVGSTLGTQVADSFGTTAQSFASSASQWVESNITSPISRFFNTPENKVSESSVASRTASASPSAGHSSMAPSSAATVPSAPPPVESSSGASAAVPRENSLSVADSEPDHEATASSNPSPRSFFNAPKSDLSVATEQWSRPSPSASAAVQTTENPSLAPQPVTSVPADNFVMSKPMATQTAAEPSVPSKQVPELEQTSAPKAIVSANLVYPSAYPTARPAPPEEKPLSTVPSASARLGVPLNPQTLPRLDEALRSRREISTQPIYQQSTKSSVSMASTPSVTSYKPEPISDTYAPPTTESLRSPDRLVANIPSLASTDSSAALTLVNSALDNVMGRNIPPDAKAAAQKLSALGVTNPGISSTTAQALSNALPKTSLSNLPNQVYGGSKDILALLKNMKAPVKMPVSPPLSKPTAESNDSFVVKSPVKPTDIFSAFFL